MANFTIAAAAEDFYWLPDLFETGLDSATITRSGTSFVVRWTSPDLGEIELRWAGTGLVYGTGATAFDQRLIEGAFTSLTVTVGGTVWFSGSALGLQAADIDHLWFGWQRPDRYQPGSTFSLFTFLMSGNDVITGSADDDDLIPGRNPGNDTIYGGGGSDYIKADMGSDRIEGGDGTDTYSLTETFYDDYATRGAVVNLVTGAATDSWGGADTLVSIERVDGSRFGDRFTGGAGNEHFRGLKGRDTIDGGDGYDTVRYDRDADYGGTRGVVVNLATGQARDGWGNLDTLSNIEAVRGSAGADSIVGNGADNWLAGGAGIDTLDGGNGTDTANFYNDRVTAGAVVNLSLSSGQVRNDGFGNVETLVRMENVAGTFLGDSLTGNASDNELYGDFGRDTLAGGGGNDVLEGGEGADRLTGGTGADQFLFNTDDDGTPWGDTITDFVSGTDDLVFDTADFAGMSTTLQFRNGSSAGGSGSWFYFNGSTRQLFWDVDGTGAAAPVLVATLTGVTSLSAGDFVLQ